MTKEMNKPSLRFPEFSDNWKEQELREISTINPRSNKLPDSFIYVDLDSVKNGILEKENRINLTDAPSRAQRLLQKNDVLFQMVRPYQRNNYFFNKNGDYVASTGYAQIRTNKNTQYLYQFLHTPRFVEKVLLRCTGTSYPAINSNDLAKIKIWFPSQKEQQKIASFLAGIDERIQQLRKKKILLEQYKKGIMQQIFAQEIRFKDEKGREFSKWNEKPLGELIFKVDKRNKEKLKYPVYSINNQAGFIPQADQFEGVDSISRGYDISLYKIIHPKTFAYNPARINVGSIGYSYDLNNILISSLYVCFQTKDELEDLYLLSYLDTPNFNKDVIENVEGGVRQYLFYENLSRIKIPLPSNAEQQKIASFLSGIDKKIELVQGQLERVQRFKKGLLQQMFV